MDYIIVPREAKEYMVKSLSYTDDNPYLFFVTLCHPTRKDVMLKVEYKRVGKVGVAKQIIGRTKYGSESIPIPAMDVLKKRVTDLIENTVKEIKEWREKQLL